MQVYFLWGHWLHSGSEEPACTCCLGRHIPRLFDFLWVAEDGMKMQGYNGSQLWDTTFAVQAITATGLGADFTECLRRAHSITWTSHR